MSTEEIFVQVSPRLRLSTTISKESTNAKDKPTLLFLHFWGGSSRTWTSLINALGDDYNIIAPSLRGWGRSKEFESPPAPTSGSTPLTYRITDYAHDILTLLSTLSTTHSYLLSSSSRHPGLYIVGHSMGGKIAQCLLTLLPFTISLHGLLLLAPAPTRSFSLPPALRAQQIHAYDSASSAEAAVRGVLLGNPDMVSAGEVAALVEDAVGGAAGARAAWPEVGMGEEYEMEVVGAVKERWKGLKVKVVCGERDRVETPEGVEERVVRVLEAAGTKVEGVVLEGVGHLLPVEASGRVAEIVREMVGRAE